MSTGFIGLNSVHEPAHEQTDAPFGINAEREIIPPWLIALAACQ